MNLYLSHFTTELNICPPSLFINTDLCISVPGPCRYIPLARASGLLSSFHRTYPRSHICIRHDHAFVHRPSFPRTLTHRGTRRFLYHSFVH